MKEVTVIMTSVVTMALGTTFLAYEIRKRRKKRKREEN
jgi:hypothetical protein